MKIFKKILLWFIAIIVIVLIVAAIAPADYYVERSIKIDKPSDEVFDYVVHLKNQDNFSVWAMMDPNMKKSFSGTDASVGFVSAWESQNEEVGKGEQEIMKIDPGKRIDFEIRFYEPFETTDKAFMITESISENETRVVWGFEGAFPYPSNLMLFFMSMDDQLGPSLGDGLENLKSILE